MPLISCIVFVHFHWRRIPTNNSKRLRETACESKVIMTFSSSFSPYGDDDIKDDAILQLSSSSPV